MLRTSLVPLALSFLAGACGKPSPPPDPFAKIKAELEQFGQRSGLVLEHDAYGDSATRLVYLEQNWNPGETLWFYHADQGSVLMPYDMLVHLEQAGRDAPFIAPDHLTRYRLLNQHKTPNNPDALPIGFARHGDNVGLTCAACHTTQINYRGTAMRIDGASTIANVPGLFGAIEEAIAATVADDAKLARYAEAVPGRGSDADRLAAARASLDKAGAYFKSYNQANRSTTIEGFGRIDAIGRIINQVIRFTSSSDNSLEPNAPTNPPFLWDAPRHDFVQWTGFAPNADVGSLARNTGEVVGVFAHVEVQNYKTADEAKKGYASSIEGNGLVSMEATLHGLWSPLWPEEILPPIDRTLAEQGRKLYAAQCISCHALIDRTDRFRQVTAMVTGLDVVGTDPTSAMNLAAARIPAGKLEGAAAWNGGTYAQTENAIRVLFDLVSRSLARQPIAAVRAKAYAKLHHLEKAEKQGQFTRKSEQDPSAELRSYKARPLNGIWATSPYLHNGSVPTLYDLLEPPAERPVRFATGRLEYDPKQVGYVHDGDVPFVIDTTVTGNSNRGHAFGTDLSDADRWALVEYLKTL